MSNEQAGPADVPTIERMKDLGTAMVSGMAQKISGNQERTQEGARLQVSQAEFDAAVEDWTAGPSQAAHTMVKQYGAPNEGTPVRMIWYDRGPWKRIEVTRDEIAHNFPAPHSDYITCWIDYRVPVDKYDDIARFDGSCLLDRTAGEAGARCDTEAANIITLNLMHEIVIGKRSVEEAREVYAENMAGYGLGRPAPYAERLHFQPANGGTMDPDEANMGAPMAHQIAEKAKDLVGAGDRDGDRSER